MNNINNHLPQQGDREGLNPLPQQGKREVLKPLSKSSLSREDLGGSVTRNIVITGGAGFIGSHVVRLFVNKYPDYKIINLDKLCNCSW